MFAFAILVGIYSYVIFSLGILGLLSKAPVAFLTILFLSFSLWFFHKNRYEIPRVNVKKNITHPLVIIFLILAAVNLLGALGPELSFDALWYHLTIPKIFIENHRVGFIPGNLFYYSVMPKLGDMLYVPSLIFGNEIVAKLIQWFFGLLCCFVIYILSRKYFDKKNSFFAVLIFYGSLVVAWESTVAYVDLIRTFFEIMAVWGIMNYFEKKEYKWIIESGVMLGLAVATKFIAIESLPIFIIFLLLFDRNKKVALKNCFTFTFFTFLVPLPWFVLAYINTGNPIYPLLSNLYPVAHVNLLNPLIFIKSFYSLFFQLDDPISPIYIMVLPLIVIYYKKLSPAIKYIALYSFLALIIWYLTPRTGGGRFILPYLPALSILAIALVNQVKNLMIKNYLYAMIIFICLITIFYRGIANLRYLPVVLGQETKREFLIENLNYNFGDFYDTDNYFKNNIKESDVVLLYGFHNLYYVNFPFIDSSFIQKGERFNYIATQNATLPKRFSHWNLIYSNSKTGVKLYSLGEEKWFY